jgi:hypothetical protein
MGTLDLEKMMSLDSWCLGGPCWMRGLTSLADWLTWGPEAGERVRDDAEAAGNGDDNLARVPSSPLSLLFRVGSGQWLSQDGVGSARACTMCGSPNQFEQDAGYSSMVH